METIEAPRLRVGLPLLFQALEKSQPRRFTIIVPRVGKNHSLVGLLFASVAQLACANSSVRTLRT